MIHVKKLDQACNPYLSIMDRERIGTLFCVCTPQQANTRRPAHKPQNTDMYIQVPNKSLYTGQHLSPRSQNQSVAKYHEIASQPMSNNNNNNGATMQEPKKEAPAAPKKQK